MNRIGITLLALGSAAGSVLLAQQTTYTSSNVTGSLVLTRTVNPRLLAQSLRAQRAGAELRAELERQMDEIFDAEIPRYLNRLHPLNAPALRPQRSPFPVMPSIVSTPRVQNIAVVPGLPVVLTPGGFNGLTHLDQRNAANGNQFSVEPPNPSIAVANGYVLLGVNNAFQVYTTAGAPVLPKVLSSNELFGVLPAIDRATGINGVFPTDMRVFWDQTINRWFVLQRAQDYDVTGAVVGSSHIYMAVSQTADPAGVYNIYVMTTTDAANPGCPCVADYPMLGADQYGFYISSNEFNTFSEGFINAQIHAISKAALASGAATPTTARVVLPTTTGFEFALHPATTPVGASFFLGNGGLEYFVSSQGRSTSDSSLAVYALTNTSSLGTNNPSLTLTQILVPTISYTFPDVASQKPGPLPYGQSLTPPGSLAFLDGGDTRIQAVSYAGGRLYTSLATQLIDEADKQVVGGGFVILSPTYRSGTLAAQVLRQGYFTVKGNNLLRPAIAVNAQGRGGIAATMVGQDHFPSAVYLPIDTFTGPTQIRLAAAGTAPEDGFTGYPGGFGPGLARWGDYSTAVIAPDGSFWMVAEYIPTAPRTQLANWGTFIARYVP